MQMVKEVPPQVNYLTGLSMGRLSREWHEQSTHGGIARQTWIATALPVNVHKSSGSMDSGLEFAVGRNCLWSCGPLVQTRVRLVWKTFCR